ncbi:VCBS domain-containing protein [Bradyrhizobium jicamae]|uniref:VCBS domain-containing protein n=1 Tax=Bradyrhizobium jicamae TaxID=280332 RepID=UPI001BA88326|nr:VCBS domain-containing protein [Bradyrhizobium jicamae]MBR0756697.1 VCBS domain-containing protein [Bradyrhizobium jicamae]
MRRPVICFINGTMFDLSGGSRMVLDRFGCGRDGAARSAAFAATRGHFALMPGETMKTGALRIDAPVGGLRGRAKASGFGMLSLTALTFVLLKEAQAADPNASLLDDDSIAYKDFAHGSFELTTKELIPRHIIVDDPGETIVLTKKGSSVSVNQFANSAERMQELHAARQDLVANLEKEMNSNGSSTPPTVDSLAPQPINFIESADQVEPGSLPTLPLIIPNQIIPIRAPPTLFTPAGPTENDTVVFDAFTATSGTFHASSTNGDTLIFGISGGTGGVTVLGGVTYDVSEGSPYGTLYLNSATGHYTFVPNSDAINALKTPTSDSFVITVSDGALSASQTFTITINGVNDAAHILGIATGAASEAGGVANAILGTVASGKLTDADVDDTPDTFTVVSSKASAGGYGSFSMTANGTWTYKVNDANSAVQKLNVGDTLTDSFTVTTIDGTPQKVTVTIHGENDAAVISGKITGTAVEAGGVANAAAGTTASGTLTDTDVDNASGFTAVSSPATSAGGYGSFTMTADGAWAYKVDDANSAVQKLNVGDTLTDSFMVTTIDGTAQEVSVTIHGANDAAVISGVTTGCVIEAGGTDNGRLGKPTASGMLTDSDVDNAPNTFTEVSSPTKSDGGYGCFTMTACGEWTYTLDNSNGAVQALNACDTLTDHFTVTTIDGTAQEVTVTIHGSNDAAVISGATTGSVTEAGGTGHGQPIACGTLTDTDVDNASNSFTAVSCPTWSDGGYGTFTMTTAGEWTYKLDNANCTVQALNPCDTLTDCFTVTTIDGTKQAVTITIHGASDADPNDFDVLATGSHVVCDPPYVHGTPKDDCIAGGADGRIVYAGAGNDTVSGSWQADFIYAGSGNDTVKGNGGDDTIYGGSGNDAIKGGDGCDTIVGGFGADWLTGGNGNDHFVFLSAADSNAKQFDTITDFQSGSDKIDLSALGSFVFADLTPASTNVPAHAVGWISDSATGSTIVYANPTDQALKIDDDFPVVVHLHGGHTPHMSDLIV